MNNSLRWHLKKLPWFLLYNYPKKLKSYEQIREKNRNITDPALRLPYPAYFSPSPMNQLCDYICTWENRKVRWDNSITDNRDLLLNHKYALEDRKILRKIRHTVNEFNTDLKSLFAKLQEERTEANFKELTLLTESYKQKLLDMEDISSEEELANYVIKVCYSNVSIGKQLAWSAFGDYLLQNLRDNSPEAEAFSIQETRANEGGMEYLGKYYKLKK